MVNILDRELESIKDLENIGRCIVSQSERIIMVRLPFSDTFKYFSIASKKYSVLQVSNESDDEIEDRRELLFVVAKYKKDEDFQQDVKEICTK